MAREMTIRQLIEDLEDLAAEVGDLTPVRLAIQPTWPFEHSIGEVISVDLNSREEDEDEETEPREPEHVVYIAEKQQAGYLPGAASRQLGWK